jgi:integrase
MKLTDIKCKSAPYNEDGKKNKLYDGGGLFLHVKKSGKYWRLKYRYGGKEKLLAIGVYPSITLAQAREAREQAKKLLQQNIDPSAYKEEQKRNQRLNAENTFEAVAREWHCKKKSGWSEGYAKTIMTRLEADVFNRIGSIPISDITPAIMLDALQDIEKRGVYEVTRRAKQYCGQIFRYAIPKGLVDRDVTADLRDSLEAKQTKHLASIEPSELPHFIKDLYRNDARMYPTTLLAVEMMMHTFVRTSELIEAKWSEFDFERKVWTIPAERMKMKKPHLVPLSTQVMKILEKLKLHNGHYDWVFASHTRPRNHMSNNAILKVLDRMGYKGRMTGHGFRSLAMTTILENLPYPFDVVDTQLAHGKSGALGAAYDRAKYLEQRKRMMQDWSNYLDRITVGGDNVIEGKFGNEK